MNETTERISMLRSLLRIVEDREIEISETEAQNLVLTWDKWTRTASAISNTILIIITPCRKQTPSWRRNDR